MQPLVGVYWPLSVFFNDIHCTSMSEVSVAAFCGCVSCGLWVPLMWSVCGRVLLWALRPFAGVYWLVGVVEGVYVSNEWSGHGSFMGVSLIVCGCL